MKFAAVGAAITVAMGGYLLYLYANGGPGNLVDVKSGMDGEVYAVQDLPNKQKAAEMLAQIKANMQKVVEYYKQHEFATEKPTQLLVERFNKGEKIVLCLRDKTRAPEYPFVPLNTVMFVVLHEMAHLMTEELSTGKHTPEFWANFRRLLEDASKIGVYEPINYSRTPVDYCGMQITDSPL